MQEHYGPREALIYRRQHKRHPSGKTFEIPLKRRLYRRRVKRLIVWASPFHPWLLGMWHRLPPTKAMELRKRLRSGERATPRV